MSSEQICDACAALLGKPQSQEPHASLKPQSGRKLAYGWHEIFLCRRCGVMLQRISLVPGASPKLGEPWSRAALAQGGKAGGKAR